MDFIAPRPENRPLDTHFSPNIFQIAYATNDIERATNLFRERYGIREFTVLEDQLPAGGRIKIRVAWHGRTMIEMIEGSGPGAEMYHSVLPAEGFAVRHHHLSMLIEGDTQWDALQANFAAQGIAIETDGTFGDAMRFCYVKAPELGHYLEYVQLYKAGWDFFGSIAAN